MADEFDLSGGMEGGFDADPETHAQQSSADRLPARHFEFQDVRSPESGVEVSQARERTRGRFALYYISGYILIVLIAMLVSFYMLYHDKLRFEDLTNMLVTISGILSGPLGFIIGYYFKAESGE